MPGWLTWLRRPRRLRIAARRKEPLPTIQETLEKLKIRHFDRDILTEMTLPEWRREFGRRGRIFQQKIFLRNVIWQFYEQIQAGNPPDFYHKRGLVRGMWYAIKTPISRYKSLRKDFYSTMSAELQLMVEKGLVSYADFQFRDYDQERRKLGKENPHIILFAEKDGFVSILEDLYELYVCTVVTLGGQAAALSTNYMVASMVEAGIDLNQEFTCLSLVDFDPRGTNIARKFVEKLRSSGIRNFRPMKQYRGEYPWLDLIQPKNLGSQDVADTRYGLKPRERGTPGTIAWAKETGGVDGRGSREFRDLRGCLHPGADPRARGRVHVRVPPGRSRDRSPTESMATPRGGPQGVPPLQGPGPAGSNRCRTHSRIFVNHLASTTRELPSPSRWIGSIRTETNRWEIIARAPEATASMSLPRNLRSLDSDDNGC